MNLRRAEVLVGAFGPGVAVGVLVAGIAIGAYVVRPESRRRLIDWLARETAPVTP